MKWTLATLDWTHDGYSARALPLREPEIRRLAEDTLDEPGDAAWILVRTCIDGALPLSWQATDPFGTDFDRLFAELASGEVPALRAIERSRLFYAGMVLGRMPTVQRTELGRIRAAMQAAHPELFREYMDALRGRLPL